MVTPVTGPVRGQVAKQNKEQSAKQETARRKFSRRNVKVFRIRNSAIDGNLKPVVASA